VPDLTRWRRWGRVPAGNRIRWERFLHALRGSPFYAVDGAHSVLERIQEAFLAGSPGKALARVPPVGLDYFRAHFPRFLNPGAPVPQRRPLAAPWGNGCRTAVIAPWFPLEAGPRVYDEVSFADLERFEPEAIAGPVAALRQAAAAILQGRLRLSSLRYGLIAFTGIGARTLRQADRDLLWHACQLPVFEQFRGIHGELLAVECEAHRGAHTMESGVLESVAGELWVTDLGNLHYPVLRLATGLAAFLHNGVCGCGRNTPRVLFADPASTL